MVRLPLPATAVNSHQHRGQEGSHAQSWQQPSQGGPAAGPGRSKQRGGKEGRGAGGMGTCWLACVHSSTTPHHPTPPHCFKSHFLCFLILQASWPHFEDKKLMAGSKGLGSVGEASTCEPTHKATSKTGIQGCSTTAKSLAQGFRVDKGNWSHILTVYP